jgi:hypothetical protein
MKLEESFQGTSHFPSDGSHQNGTNLAGKGISLQRDSADEHAPGYRGATMLTLLFL